MNNMMPVNSAPRADLTIGRILLEQGKLSTPDAERVLTLQKEKNLRFGEAAVQLGLISEADMRQALARQFDYPYLNKGDTTFSPALIAAYDPFSPHVEALRALRTQLMLRWFSHHKSLAVIGVSAKDGASYVTANLAIVFSQLGERTLLIDANLRNSQVSTMFNLNNRLGLSDLLADRIDLSAITRITSFVDLSILPAGTEAPNPGELLARNKMEDLLQVVSSDFDVILVDTPPANEATDFQAVAVRTQGALISVQKNRTRISDVAVVKEMLEAAGAVTAGAVVNSK